MAEPARSIRIVQLALCPAWHGYALAFTAAPATGGLVFYVFKHFMPFMGERAQHGVLELT